MIQGPSRNTANDPVDPSHVRRGIGRSVVGQDNLDDNDGIRFFLDAGIDCETILRRFGKTSGIPVRISSNADCRPSPAT